MPYTVPYSFDVYRSKLVDLDSDDVKKARRSRDYLKEQIEIAAGKVEYFPKLYGGYVAFGSFARRTKVRPLDDIDLLLLISAGKGSYTQYLGFNTYAVIVADVTCPTWYQTNDDNKTLNSRKVLNKLKATLEKVENYKKSDIKYTGEAVVLGLKSYDWNFDIVPAIPVGNNSAISHYLIPDGNGNWKRTDPRVDQRVITTANQYHNEHLIPLIRVMKYWNVRYYDVPRISSYYLENMLISGFNLYNPLKTSERGAVKAAFDVLHRQIFQPCPDPKGLEATLDGHESYETKLKVWNVTSTMATYAANAIAAEDRGDNKAAIEWWCKVLPGFPKYGDI